jgi:hypothetical protein
MTDLFPKVLRPSLSTGASYRHLTSLLAFSAAALFASVSSAATDSFSFTHVGILPDGESSEVIALNDAMTLAGCSTTVVAHDVRGYYQRKNSARWTPAEGLKALPLLPYSSAAANDAGARSGYVAGNDVTPDGTKLVFSSHTTPTDGRAAGMCNADGSNLVVFTTMPGGEKMQTAKQISDDGTIVIGSSYPDYLHIRTTRWTAATGFEELALPAGYNLSAPAYGGISGDGSVSAGYMWSYDADGNVTAEQAYRWTAGSGMLGIGYVVGDNRSDAYNLSQDGKTILGISWKSNPDFSDGPTNLFVWNAETGLKDLSGPAERINSYYRLWATGMSGEGSVVSVSYYRLNQPGDCQFNGGNDPNCDPAREYLSYIINPARGYYIDLRDAIKRAGGDSAIAGWTNFNINGVTDDGNTVYGHARNADGKDEGFIAHFPAGLLASLEKPARLLNISTRLRVGSGEKVSIAGFIVSGTVPKGMIIRGIGPSLGAHGVQGALADPVLELHKPDGTIVVNDEWKSNHQAEIQATGVAPGNDHEAAIIATLAPGNYTAVLSGKGGSTGIGLIEAYDLETAINARVANISTRGFVDAGDNAMIGGAYIGNDPTLLLIRAIGPSLQASGITGALQNPTLELRNADGSLLDSNDDWKTNANETAIKATGVAPTDDRESALIEYQAGTFTAIVRDANGDTGVALVEVYDLGL